MLGRRNQRRQHIPAASTPLSHKSWGVRYEEQGAPAGARPRPRNQRKTRRKLGDKGGTTPGKKKGKREGRPKQKQRYGLGTTRGFAPINQGEPPRQSTKTRVTRRLEDKTGKDMTGGQKDQGTRHNTAIWEEIVLLPRCYRSCSRPARLHACPDVLPPHASSTGPRLRHNLLVLDARARE